MCSASFDVHNEVADLYGDYRSQYELSPNALAELAESLGKKLDLDDAEHVRDVLRRTLRESSDPLLGAEIADIRARFGLTEDETPSMRPPSPTANEDIAARLAPLPPR